MAEVRIEAHPMVGGHGEYSYAKNSSTQKAAVERSKDVLVSTISHNLDIQSRSSRTSFHIADLGCSIGPATFYAVESIIEAIKIKYQSEMEEDEIPKYFVFFNDHFGNDFNALFDNLPSERQYIAAAVPGSFHAKLFPNAWLDIAYSSNATQWLSKLPEDVSNASSPSYNKGRIFYANAPVEVCRVFSAQFAKDFESFICARAEEMIPGGLVALLFPGRPDGVPPSKTYHISFSILESCLVDMTQEDIVSEEIMDSFNLPLYFASPEELKKIIKRNKCFEILKLEAFPAQFAPVLSKQQARAGLGGVFTTYFGIEIVKELFQRYGNKIEGLGPHYPVKEGNPVEILIVLKRKN